MDPENSRRERLAQLLDLAEAYRGWTRKELARTLGRDPTKLIPGRGVPKLDLVVGLASALDWPVGDVVNFLWNHQPPPDVDGSADFEALDAAARQAHRAGQYRLMVDLAQRAYGAADTPQERARACNREAGGWDGLARHTEVLRVVTRALQEKGVCAELRRVLESNLANAYYSLWSLVEARSIAQGLIDGYERQPPRTPRDRKTQAFARYVCGHTLRRLISLEPQRADAFATAARRHLDIARALYEQLAVELGDERLEGIANTCRGGIIEVDVELGRREVADALAELRDGLDEVWDITDEVIGDRLESLGWWCIFGCNLALRHVNDERALQQHMAVFTNKADEIANKLDNWSMRERVFTMHYTRWERALGATGFQIPCVIDRDDVRIIAGTMGRFPTFRETGWRILQSAQVVDGK